MIGKDGFSLVELIVALAILAIGIAGATALLLLAGREMERAEIALRAALLALERERGGATSEAPVQGGKIVAESLGGAVIVRFEPTPGGDPERPRHPPLVWVFGG